LQFIFLHGLGDSGYDIYNLHIDSKQDEKGIIEASFVAAEISNGIPSKRIVIGGFSQGGSVALYHAVTANRTYGGVVALSSWLPLHSNPFYSAHSNPQGYVLKGFHLTNCDFCTYNNMGHSSCDQVIVSYLYFCYVSRPLFRSLLVMLMFLPIIFLSPGNE
uniref:palmitoyl-protein hydrolase n=1 Tax=Echinostoma caproni TaxID=27848 RepID=A0A183AHG8_9TREM